VEERPFPCFVVKNLRIVMAVLMLLCDFGTGKTTIGRRLCALGGNEHSALLYAFCLLQRVFGSQASGARATVLA
jgi:ribose/xylose/arabinose/galactoside ABC-type transport system permease subunit